MPCTHFCGTPLHPQRPKYWVEGAATCPARTSVALPCTLSSPTLLLPQRPKHRVEGAATCPARFSVALPCTLSSRNTGLRGQHYALHASLRHFPAPSAAEIQGRGGSNMPCTHLCGTSLHPQRPKHWVEGAATCPARTSVAHSCTLSRRNNGLLGKK